MGLCDRCSKIKAEILQRREIVSKIPFAEFKHKDNYYVGDALCYFHADEDVVKSRCCNLCEFLDALGFRGTPRCLRLRLLPRRSKAHVHDTTTVWLQWVTLCLRQYDTITSCGLFLLKKYLSLGETALVHRQMTPLTGPASCQISSVVPMGDRANLQAAQKWIQLCHLTHSKCQIATNPVASLRMIDCLMMRVVFAPTSPFTYAALSYVWGPKQHEAAATSLTLKPIPRTIHDAIVVCKSLQIPYLWVDRYCIDHNNVADSMHQINNMHRIYEQAYLVIIAENGTDAEAGLSGIEVTPRQQMSSQVLDEIGVTNMPSQSFVEASVWSTRGWTLQEKFFSVRSLTFHSKEMVFRCTSGMACYESEVCLHDPFLSLSTDLSKYRNRDNGLMFTIAEQIKLPSNPIIGRVSSLWARIADFTGRQLTRDEDSLRAFAGVLQYAAQLENPVLHYWGVPFSPDHTTTPLDGDFGRGEYTFIKSLCWRHAMALGYRRPGFPSWSWAGWRGTASELAIAYGTQEHFSKRIFARLLIKDDHSRQLDFNSECWNQLSQPNSPVSINVHAASFPASHLQWPSDGEITAGSRASVWHIGRSFRGYLNTSLLDPKDSKLNSYMSQKQLRLVVLFGTSDSIFALVVEDMEHTVERVGIIDIFKRETTSQDIDGELRDSSTNESHSVSSDYPVGADQPTPMLKKLLQETEAAYRWFALS